MHATQTYHLPIPTNLTAFALALPPLSGLAIEAATTLTRKGAPRRDALTLRSNSTTVSSLPLILTLGVLAVYETVVATLAGTYIAPQGSLECGLRDGWYALWNRDGEAIRRIQDAFNCCGFKTLKDRAWPKAQNGGPALEACREMYGRDQACFGSLRGEEQKVAGMLIAVAVGVFLWKVLIVSIPTSQPSWFSQMFDDDTSVRAGQRALEYQTTPVADEYEPYSDRAPSQEEIRDEVNQGTQRAIEDIREGRQNGRNVVPSALIPNGNEWSRD
ncbi:hypothetical protein EV356DRAFT_498056 [Viridothelium virens]|uniref:Tetraspanin Tsp3 n=1 Tax=Viridothelium virens TaxID=1048519 RepID=A0A6A6HEN4_VIRVR|nr:hypothetical protein EV356DRAFT_498056 [Viridothelium virens]